jgi:hypothetical protein
MEAGKWWDERESLILSRPGGKGYKIGRELAKPLNPRATYEMPSDIPHDARQAMPEHY